MDIAKVPGQTLGFSIAGGRGSTPAYEDVDDVRQMFYFVMVYVTGWLCKVSPFQ